jgi:hypothetical protein
METKIIKKYGFDVMSISAKFPSGASYKFTAGRSGERLAMAFSNNDAESKIQIRIFQEFMKFRKGEINQGRFDRLEELTKKCQSGKMLIKLMEESI